MCLPSTFWRTERRTVVILMTSQFGCLELLITRTFLSGPVVRDNESRLYLTSDILESVEERETDRKKDFKKSISKKVMWHAGI